ncbi:SDR family oxidoreductase [Kineococcus sp. SYSU DK006]|uniref:SDR family oxidoreductase n=1 Tax=Kineococcus sp. SYSU DK006 TaxID=3383127 RepID=UPI003D7F080C
MTSAERPLSGVVALVAGATRGAGRGIAVALGAAGATVYCSGRSNRGRRSDYDRPETVEQTADLVEAAGGTGIACITDHLDPAQVRTLVSRIDHEQGRLDVLVNDIGGEHYVDFGKTVWEYDLDRGLALLRAGLETHLITSAVALGLLTRRPGGLVVEVTDGTTTFNTPRFRETVFMDVTKHAVNRLAWGQGHELERVGGTAVAVTPGWLRSEMMLDVFGVREDSWLEATKQPKTDGPDPADFAISESPAMIGRAVAALAADPDKARWNKASVTSHALAEHYGTTDADGSRPDAWRYVEEVRERGLPADVTGYR